jgi:hypothetical protein
MVHPITGIFSAFGIINNLLLPNLVWHDSTTGFVFVDKYVMRGQLEDTDCRKAMGDGIEMRGQFSGLELFTWLWITAKSLKPSLLQVHPDKSKL